VRLLGFKVAQKRRTFRGGAQELTIRVSTVAHKGRSFREVTQGLRVAHKGKSFREVARYGVPKGREV